MHVKSLIVSEYQTNCYLLEKNNNILIIDPGDSANRIMKEIGNKKVLAILVTHNHLDHTKDVLILKNKYNVPVYNFSNLKECSKKIGDFSFEIILTPGHTDDSLSFYFREEKIIFTGDFLFKGTIGRTDMETGSMEKMQDSIMKIKKYDENIIIYPGHGPNTKLKTEFRNNPFF